MAVLVAVHNEADNIAEKLRELSSIEYPADRLQLLVIDGGSSDGTAAALEPGQWAWSAMVLSETLFTTCIAACLLAGCAYLRHRRLPMLLLAVGAAVLAAYARVVAYLLPLVVLIAAV